MASGIHGAAETKQAIAEARQLSEEGYREVIDLWLLLSDVITLLGAEYQSPDSSEDNE